MVEKALRKDSRQTYAVPGLAIGVLLMIVTWFVPIPVAIFVSLFNIKHHLGMSC